SGSVMKMIAKIMPAISDTERTALEAGVVWVEGDLFSGKPDFKKLMNEPYPQLTAEEKAFVEGPVEKFCAMIDDWEIWQRRDLSPQAWEYLKKEKFLGMIIPKEYGGLGFSALCHSEVIQKLSSRSVAACISVMVPNSLGPAELLIHYGTEEQRKKYLPLLATGEEMPCFALTEPTAGSDAGSLTATGDLFKGDDGKLYIRLNWNKRWITLASIATLLGLAFRLRDPNNLLGKGEDLGITCALIPTKLPGVMVGRRHDPLGVPFYNCPTQGKDVVVSVDQIIGGLDGAGKGWGMLMESLAAGRGVSLPAQSTGGVKYGARVVSAHASVRKQFGMAIGKFEGLEEPMARIFGSAYLLEAMRRWTCGALDKGIKPPVITAMAKYNATEIGRKCINDAMDIVGGQAISRGPRNTLAHTYIAMPIGITVEGANIMTRTLIIFGQGAMRAHPFAFREVAACEKRDVAAFDSAFWGHVGHVVRNTFRSIALSVTRGYIAPSPIGGSVAKYFRRLTWASASFAIMADIAMGTLGGDLKRREKITGRFADILSWMYISTAVLRRYIADGQRKEDLPFVHFCLNHGLYEIQKAFDGLFANMRVPGMTWFFRGPLRWWSNLNALAGESKDEHTHKIASLMMADTEQRHRLTEGIFVSKDVNDSLGRYEHAFKIVKRAETAERKIREAIRNGTMPKMKGAAAAQLAYDKGVITSEEFGDLKKADEVRLDAVQVDDFSQEEYVQHSVSAKTTGLPSSVSNGSTGGEPRSPMVAGAKH
ncbi:MAG: acyl-CoA dehydrogenase, partial [Bdellovibrionaceae bacterium]|nr:acyl-CoA dehydrogenase [Pseudobdellovibrionaceae bacterium]